VPSGEGHQDLAAGTSTWIFQSNPELFDLPAALAELSELTWVAREHVHEIMPGDTVYLWESGRDAGIVARARVMTAPAEMPQDEPSDGAAARA